MELTEGMTKSAIALEVLRLMAAIAETPGDRLDIGDWLLGGTQPTVYSAAFFALPWKPLNPIGAPGKYSDGSLEIRVDRVTCGIAWADELAKDGQICDAVVTAHIAEWLRAP